jgi:hypothetical protein
MAASVTAFTTHTPAPEVDYPTADGRPTGETDLHRNVMVATIETLKIVSCSFNGKPKATAWVSPSPPRVTSPIKEKEVFHANNCVTVSALTSSRGWFRWL